MSKQDRWLIAAVSICLLTLLGCKKSPSGQAQPTPGSQPVAQNSSGIPRVDQRLDNSNRLRQIGQAYLAQSISGPVNGPADLGKDIPLTDARQQPFVIVWGVDLNQAKSVNAQALLAWEKDPDTSGNRQVLHVDGSVTRLSEAEFQKAPRAGKL